MVLHAFTNFAAVFLGLITRMLKDSDLVPMWFVVIMLTGILLAFIFIMIIRNKYREYRECHDAVTPDANHIDVSTDQPNDTKTQRPGVLHFVPLLLAAAIFVGVGVSEIRLRSNTVVSEMVDSGYSKISIRKTSPDASVRLIDFELYDQKTYEFEWRNDYKVEYMHGAFKLIGPDGSVHHTVGPILGKVLTVSGGKQQSIISGKGQWQLVIAGKLEDIEIEINWTLKRLP